MVELEDFWGLGLALAIGLLIGLEHGWREREAPEGRRAMASRLAAVLGVSAVAGAAAFLWEGPPAPPTP